MPRTAPLLAIALAVVLSGCVFGWGGQSGYVLSAERVPAGGLADHATVDPGGDARDVLAESVENGTANTSGWRAVRNGSLVAVDGSYYRFRVEETGRTERTVPGIAVVRTNESADVDDRDLPSVDSRGVKLAARFAQIREREDGALDDPKFAQPYFHGVDDSRLLSSNGTVVSATGERWRVIVFENVTREVTVRRYEAELVANSGAQLERELAVDVSGLPNAQRGHLENAIEEGETLVPTDEVESGEAEAFVGLVRTLGFRLPAERWEISGDPQSTYVTYDGRVYAVEFWWRSGE